MNRIKHIISSPFHPATNGLAVRAVQTIKRGLDKMGGDLKTRMFEFLGRYRIKWLPGFFAALPGPSKVHGWPNRWTRVDATQ